MEHYRVMTSRLRSVRQWGLLFAMVCGMAQAEVSYFHSDHLGSVTVVTNSAGRVQQIEDYTPFGEILAPSPQGGEGWGEEEDYLYTSQELDRSTELYYYGARYYDPTLSLFLTVDPVEGNPPYVYTHQNPLAFVDPEGRDPLNSEMDRFLGNLDPNNPIHRWIAESYLRSHGGSLDQLPPPPNLNQDPRFRWVMVSLAVEGLGVLVEMITPAPRIPNLPEGLGLAARAGRSLRQTVGPAEAAYADETIEVVVYGYGGHTPQLRLMAARKGSNLRITGVDPVPPAGERIPLPGNIRLRQQTAAEFLAEGQQPAVSIIERAGPPPGESLFATPGEISEKAEELGRQVSQGTTLPGSRVIIVHASDGSEGALNLFSNDHHWELLSPEETTRTLEWVGYKPPLNFQVKGYVRR